MAKAGETKASGDQAYDFIIIGAGTAGCLLANRLSADPANRVLLLEAGGTDNWIWYHIPAGYLFLIGNPRSDWMFKTAPSPGLNGRELSYPRGKVLGGCSTINGMIYMRGQKADYDGWAQQGLPGWGWNEVLPYFMRHEDHFGGASALHGAGGEWRIEEPRIRWDILDAFRDAAAERGIPKVADFNTGDNEGSSYFQVNQKAGRRWSAARGFLDPVRHRPNLTILTGVHVDRIGFEGRRASVVEARVGREKRRFAAHTRIILAAGAIASPKLLMHSGIGRADDLHALGIVPLLDRPGVGANLQDHLQLRPIYKVEGVRTLNADYANLLKRAWMGVEYALFRRGPLSMAPSQLGVFARSNPRYETANVEFHVQPLSLEKFGDGLHPFPAFTASVCNLRPTSRGEIRLASADPGDAPIIDPNYLSTQEDRQVAVESLRLVREIVDTSALRRFSPQEFRPGAHIVDDADLIKAAGDIGTTIFHPVGTARMGRADDPSAVVDSALRVIGTEGLSVIDASVMPSITSGNTNSPTLMIAEKGAEAVLAAARRGER